MCSGTAIGILSRMPSEAFVVVINLQQISQIAMDDLSALKEALEEKHDKEVAQVTKSFLRVIAAHCV